MEEEGSEGQGGRNIWRKEVGDGKQRGGREGWRKGESRGGVMRDEGMDGWWIEEKQK